MCGRTAQTRAAVRAAAEILGAPQPSQRNNQTASSSTPAEDSGEGTTEQQPTSNSNTDNFNLCPGMEAVVFVHNHESSSLETSVKVWGLITKPGTKNHPLVEGMGKHFEALMYNARTDTLMEKATFGKLVNKQQSCIVAVNGWFEWKQELKGKKQPYFCTAKNQQYVLFPGLWTTTQTGVGDETLTTFTILTTDAAPCLQWLHTRMPVCCWNTDLAHQWLQQPTSTTLQALEADNVTGSEPALAWHAVTPDMTNLKYRSDKAIQPLKRATVTNFFSAVNKDEAKSASAQKKRPAAASTVSPAKNLKKASIADFFSPKSK